MAERYGSASVFLYVDGYIGNNWDNQGLDVTVKSVLEEVTGLGDTSRKHDPVGLIEVTLEQTGAFWDTSSNSSHDAFSASVPTTPQDAVRVICLGFGGDTAGKPFVGFEGAYTSAYEVVSQQGTLARVNLEHVISGDPDWGYIVQPTVTQTADFDTEAASIDYTTIPQQVIPITSNSQANPSVVTTTVPHGLTSGDVILISGVTGSDADINGEQTVTVISTTTFSVPVDASVSPGTGGSFVRADSSNGAVGYQQVTAFSGFTGYIGTLEDSADDAVWASLIAFTDVTSAPAFERKTVAGQVDRYIAYDGNVTGTGSITVFAGIKRNP